MEQVDFFVIGAGSGGVRASRTAAKLGARVAIAEERYLGGTCVNVGCVPKKLFVYGSQFREAFERAAGYGWQVPAPDFDWPLLKNNKDKEIARLNSVYENLLVSSGVALLEGHARLLDAHTVAVGKKRYRAEHILLAVGGWPFIPDIPGRELAISSNEAFALDKLPDKIVIVGGGYIAAEFAGIFNGFGVETHLIYRGELFLRGFDDDLRHHMVDEIQKKGVHLHFECDVKSISRDQNGSLTVSLDNGEHLSAGQVMYATGRRPKLDDLGLDNTRVQISDKGAIVVDDDYRTHESSIYAIGDAIDRIALTPVALAEGMALAHRLFGEAMQPVSYHNVPTAVFTQPNIASVGLTETEARKAGSAIRIYRSTFTPLPLTLTGSTEKALVKLVVDSASDKVLGCHLVGPDAGEIIQGFAVAINMGATKADFDRTMGIHPTLAEELVTLREPV